MKKKLEFEREQALAKQQVRHIIYNGNFLGSVQIEFQIKKIEELQKQMDDQLRMQDEKISKYNLPLQALWLWKDFTIINNIKN